jgi:hypothetical protein
MRGDLDPGEAERPLKTAVPRSCDVINVKGRWSECPGGKHLRGVGNKEQRMYEHIKESAQKEGRYGKRAKEVAARTVMKMHKEKEHKKGR